jgi:large subunit ribosomal protein L23
LKDGIPLYEVLRRPVITEKANTLQSLNKYVFEAASGANKIQIKQAVEMAFKVKVKSVNVMTVPGKTKRFGRRAVKGPAWKKAVVTLMEGHKIQLFEGT